MNYYYAGGDGQPVGPLTAGQMQDLYRTGTIDDTTWVIEEGAADWKPYAAAVPSVEDDPAPPPAGPECRHCLAGNPPGARFCESCGEPLDEAAGAVLPPAADAEPEDPPPPAAPTVGLSKHAFLSHSSRDHDVALQICEILESRGVSCWIAPRDIDPGTPYDEEIIRGIESSQTFILLLSGSSNESQHVKRELMRALRASHPIYPIRIQKVEPGPKLEYLLEGIHWVDAWAPPLEEHLDRLAELILTAGPDAKGHRAPAGRKFGVGPLWRVRRGWRIAGGIAVTLSLLAVAWAAMTWRTGIISGIVDYVTRQMESRLGAVGEREAPRTTKPADDDPPAATGGSGRYAALVAEGAEAAAARRWQDAINAYEAAVALSNQFETAMALDRAKNALRGERETAVAYARAIAAGELSEKKGDFREAQRDYEGAARSAQSDADRAQALDKARRAGESIALQARREDVDRILRAAVEFEGQKDWDRCSEECGKALAAAPDEPSTNRVLELQKRLASAMAEEVKNRRPVEQTFQIGCMSKSGAPRKYPASGQVRDVSGEVLGELAIEIEFFGTTAKMFFTRAKRNSRADLCTFRNDDAVGLVRVAEVDGVSFSFRITELKNGLAERIETLAIQVTAKR